LSEVELSSEQALLYHQQIIREIIRMLCAGIIHGDLSEFNILLAVDGPVIIDLPQAVNAAGNNNARMMLDRDVTNMRQYFGRFAPELLKSEYGKEMWSLYEHGNLLVDTQLTGRFQPKKGRVDVKSIIKVIDDAKQEALEQRQRKTGIIDR
jgi:RIO kinase 1